MDHIFSQNCLVTLVITASFEFWFLVRSQLAPRFLRESFLLNSKLILNQNPDTHVQKRTCEKKYMCTKKSTYCRSIPFHMICKGRIMIIVIDLSIRTHRATLGICRHSICIFSQFQFPVYISVKYSLRFRSKHFSTFSLFRVFAWDRLSLWCSVWNKTPSWFRLSDIWRTLFLFSKSHTGTNTVVRNHFMGRGFPIIFLVFPFKEKEYQIAADKTVLKISLRRLKCVSQWETELWALI